MLLYKKTPVYNATLQNTFMRLVLPMTFKTRFVGENYMDEAGRSRSLMR